MIYELCNTHTLLYLPTVYIIDFGIRKSHDIMFIYLKYKNNTLFSRK